MAGLGPPSSAQTPEPDTGEDEIVCVAIARHRWEGSPQETKAIQSKPVPESYSWPYSGPGCDYAPLPGDIIVWHLSFGTEASALAAADVIMSKMLKVAPASGVRTDLIKAWRVALRDWQAAERRLARDPRNKAFRQARWEGDWRLEELTDAAVRYGEVASLLLDIADVFASQRALAQAERLIAAEEEARAFLTQDLAQSPDLVPDGYRQNLSENDDWRHEGLRLRAAVLRARLLRSPEAIDAAAEHIQASYGPELRDAWTMMANQQPVRDFCDIDDRVPAVADACGNHSDFEGEVADFFHAAAQLEIVMADRPNYARGTWDPELVAEWEEIRSREGWWDGPPRRTELEIHRLLTLVLMRADLVAQEAAKDERKGDLYRAEELLLRAERLAPPDLAPTRFRQIAERYFRVRQSMLASAEDSEHREQIAAARSRKTSYFRLVLENLDALATAE